MSLLTPPLESFLAIAALNNVSAAAKRLHLTQPAVTKQLRALEQLLGVKLVQRTPRGVRLTAAGELLRDYGKRSAALLDECQVALAELETGHVGALAIGAGVTTSMFQLPGWLSRYRSAWPRVEVRVRTGSSSAIAELVRAREVDCGFVTSELKQRELLARPLYREEILLVVAAKTDYPARVALADLPLIMFPRHAGFRRFLERSFENAGLHAEVKMEIDSVEATKSLVAMGLGAAFLPAPAVSHELARTRLRKLSVQGLPRLYRQTTLLLRKDRRRSAALQHFLQVVEEA